MRDVADALGTSTSTVSQQVAALAREAGAALVEPAGRGVRLTPAGRRLAEHAVTILAAVDAATLDLDPAAEPSGTVRIAGFATAIRRSVLPVVRRLETTHPGVRVVFHEQEPFETFDLLAADKIDLGLTYDYNLAPGPARAELENTPLWTTAWGLGVPTPEAPAPGTGTLGVFESFRRHTWIGNSRNTADETVLRTIAAMAGFEPRLAHTADSLELVQDLIVAGLGVGMLPADQATRPGVTVVRLHDPAVVLRASAVIRRGHAGWPPLALILRMLTAARSGGRLPAPGG
jgi:DNA-binding transcriptional LysR family regulator